MFRLNHIPFEDTKALNKLALDYLNRNELLTPFYRYFPDQKGFSEILSSDFANHINRKVLHATLLSQSAHVENTTSETLQNIERLKEKNVYTVTTGHQLCLFTGPLYFIYKIFSAINLAGELNKKFPDSRFVPVYWLAGEDHDFEEINHFHVFGKTLRWESSQTGCTGDFTTSELRGVYEQFKQIVGAGPNSEKLISLFENSYLRNTNLKTATRYLVNELFGKYGLVTLNGNDKELKGLARNIFRKDIFENLSFKKVNESIEQLRRLKYEPQVNPRRINCFYIGKSLRARIENEDELFVVSGTEIKFTRQELENIIDEHPEKISPNVVLRPLYQQFILPNIAYIGGPGELAYWLEYKNMFDEYGVQFPVLVPRSFITVIDKNIRSKAEKLGFAVTDFFKNEEELVKEFLVKRNDLVNLEKEQKNLSALFNEIKKTIAGVDKTLEGSVAAEEQKAIKGLEVLTMKANRALKQRSETEIGQIRALKQKLFPNGEPQERYANFSSLYTQWGEQLFTFLKDNTRPLDFRHNLIEEEF